MAVKNFKVYVTVYHSIDGVEASSKEEAREKAATDYIWDDHINDVIIDVEEEEEDGWILKKASGNHIRWEVV